MLLHMKRTTLILDEHAFRRLKRLAAGEGRTMTELVNEFIRTGLESRKEGKAAPQKKLPVFDMGRPAVDLTDREALAAIMEKGS